MIERACIIAVANLLFFAKTLTYKYCSDDLPSSRREHSTPKWKHWLYVLEGREKSWMQMDHAITLLLHTLTAIGIYLGFGANDVSFWGAILFSFNPINNQGSVWISGRSYVLPALGMSWAMAIPVLAPFFLLGATYFNAGFLAPAVLYLWNPWLAAWLPFCWAFHYKRFRLNVGRKVAKEMFAEDRKIHWRKLVLATKTFGFYTVHALIPFRTSFYHAFLQSAAGCMAHKAKTMKDRFFWAGVISILAIGYLVMEGHPTVKFGLLWWVAGILPFLNLFRIHQEIGERYAYLPLVGLMIALSWFLQGHPVAFAIMVTMYATRLWFYMDAFTDDYYLVEHARLNSPDGWFPWHVAAMKRWDAGSHKEAIIMWTMARMISPNEFKLNFNLASALKMAKQDKEADQLMQIAVQNVPGGQEASAAQLINEWKKGNITILL